MVYNNYSSYIKSVFGARVQKVSLNTGFICPNMDGTKGTGGCTYCNNSSFNPSYCRPKKSITQQIDEGIAFFSKKYKTQKYLAYFQAYTNTYNDYEIVEELFIEAVNHPDVVGLVIGTRPDCMSKKILDLLASIAKDYYVSLEFGVESTLNKTLEIINRCHTYEETMAAYEMAKDYPIDLGAHLILGLPGESKEEMLSHATTISKLPIKTLKIHQLQIIRNTKMAKQLKEDPSFFNLFDLEEYIAFVSEFVALLREDIIIERFSSESPAGLLIAPQWGGVKNFEITEKVKKYLTKNNLYQGINYTNSPTFP